MLQSKNIGRRELLRHGGTAALAIAVATTGAVVVGAADDAYLETQIRLFVRSLLSERHKLTAGSMGRAQKGCQDTAGADR